MAIVQYYYKVYHVQKQGENSQISFLTSPELLDGLYNKNLLAIKGHSTQKLSIQAPPGTELLLNNKSILIGQSGIYDFDHDDIVLNSIKIVQPKIFTGKFNLTRGDQRAMEQLRDRAITIWSTFRPSEDFTPVDLKYFQNAYLGLTDSYIFYKGIVPSGRYCYTDSACTIQHGGALSVSHKVYRKQEDSSWMFYKSNPTSTESDIFPLYVKDQDVIPSTKQSMLGLHGLETEMLSILQANKEESSYADLQNVIINYIPQIDNGGAA